MWAGEIILSKIRLKYSFSSTSINKFRYIFIAWTKPFYPLNSVLVFGYDKLHLSFADYNGSIRIYRTQTAKNFMASTF